MEDDSLVTKVQIEKQMLRTPKVFDEPNNYAEFIIKIALRTLRYRPATSSYV
jgi:hypothetical protein